MYFRQANWVFEMENDRVDRDFEDYQVSVAYLERRTGILLWDNLVGPEIDK